MNSQQQQDAVRKVLQDACEEMRYMPTRTKVNNEIEVVYNTVFRLSHVLRAIAKQPVPIHWVAVDCFGDFLDMDHEGNKDMALENGTRWNLSQDDLSLQSTETVNFLFKILCE